MAEVAKAYVTLIPSAKGFASGIQRQIGGDVERSSRSAGKRGGELFARGYMGPLKAIGGAAIALFAVDKIAGFFKTANAEARESQKVGALTAQVIKTTGGAAHVTAKQVGDLATAISNKTGIDDEAIQSGSNLLLTFKNIRNEAGKGNDIFNQATQSITDLGAAMGKDPKSAAIQLGKALNDPVKGITALTRVGVSFTDQQKKQIKAMVASGDTLGAQKIILGELKSEFGGAAAASATAGEKFSTTFKNFEEAVGTALLPILDAVLGAATNLFGLLTGKVGPAFSSLAKFIQPAVDTVKVFFAALTGSGGDRMALPWMTPIIQAALRVRAVFATIKDAVAVFFDALSGKALLVKGPMETVGKAAYGIRNAFGQVVTVAKNLVPVLADLVTSGWGLLSSAVKVLAQILTGPVLSAIVSVSGFLSRHTTLLKGAVVVIGSMIAAYKVYRAVVVVASAAQAILNAVLTANPIGLVVLALVGLAAGLIYAYKHSEKFRAVVQVAFQAISTAASFMWNNVLKPTFKFIVSAFLAVAGAIVHGAALAFGWVPGIGPKLKAAAAKFDDFRDSVNAALDGTKDYKTIKVTTPGADAAIAKLAALRYQQDHIDPVVTIRAYTTANKAGFRAAGGPVTAGQPYVVGEKRPELFVPNQSGRIIPRVPGSGTTVNFNGNVGYSPDEIARRIDVKTRDALAVAHIR